MAKVETQGSSNLHAYEYDPATRVLTVRFRNGGVYAYDGVPADDFERFKSDKSLGSYLHQFIKGKYSARKLK